MPDWTKKASRSTARSLGSGDCLDSGCLEGTKIVRGSEDSLDGPSERKNEIRQRAKNAPGGGGRGRFDKVKFRAVESGKIL